MADRQGPGPKGETMSMGECTVPVSTEKAEIRNFAMDSRRWAAVEFREGDVVIASWAKSGTTWVQQIVGQLLLGPQPNLKIDRLSPWLENRFTPLRFVLRQLRNQPHRRFIKTHLPADAIPMSPQVRYLFVGRDPRDVVHSLYHFHRIHTPLAYRIINETPGRVGRALEPPADDFAQYFDEWLAGDGDPWWPYWSHVRSWWALRSQANVRLVHFSRLKRDLSSEIQSIAKFLGVSPPHDGWDEVFKLCGFASMKSESAEVYGAHVERIYQGGMQGFFRKGGVGEWRNLLTAEHLLDFDRRAKRELEPACLRWLMTGELTE